MALENPRFFTNETYVYMNGNDDEQARIFKNFKENIDREHLWITFKTAYIRQKDLFRQHYADYGLPIQMMVMHGHNAWDESASFKFTNKTMLNLTQIYNYPQSGDFVTLDPVIQVKFINADGTYHFESFQGDPIYITPSDDLNYVDPSYSKRFTYIWPGCKQTGFGRNHYTMFEYGGHTRPIGASPLSLFELSSMRAILNIGSLLIYGDMPEWTDTITATDPSEVFEFKSNVIKVNNLSSSILDQKLFCYEKLHTKPQGNWTGNSSDLVDLNNQTYNPIAYDSNVFNLTKYDETLMSKRNVEIIGPEAHFESNVSNQLDFVNPSNIYKPLKETDTALAVGNQYSTIRKQYIYEIWSMLANLLLSQNLAEEVNGKIRIYLPYLSKTTITKYGGHAFPDTSGFNGEYFDEGTNYCYESARTVWGDVGGNPKITDVIFDSPYVDQSNMRCKAVFLAYIRKSVLKGNGDDSIATNYAYPNLSDCYIIRKDNDTELITDWIKDWLNDYVNNYAGERNVGGFFDSGQSGYDGGSGGSSGSKANQEPSIFLILQPNPNRYIDVDPNDPESLYDKLLTIDESGVHPEGETYPGDTKHVITQRAVLYPQILLNILYNYPLMYTEGGFTNQNIYYPISNTLNTHANDIYTAVGIDHTNKVFIPTIEINSGGGNDIKCENPGHPDSAHYYYLQGKSSDIFPFMNDVPEACASNTINDSFLAGTCAAGNIFPESITCNNVTSRLSVVYNRLSMMREVLPTFEKYCFLPGQIGVLS